jgi:riboflavin synthase
MFTGLIEDIGRIAAISPLPSGKGLRLTLAAPLFAEPMPLGASLCTDGVCLTVVACRPAPGHGEVDVEVGPETLSRTTLGRRQPGHPVNLERALRLSDRLGGHLVTGHVDGVGRVATRTGRGEALDLCIALPPALARYVVEKGAIAVDGISLTVNAVTEAAFAVSLIPHTQARTTLESRGPGQEVNLEVDIIGKYVEKLLSGYRPAGLTLDKLKEHGFAPHD